MLVLDHNEAQRKISLAIKKLDGHWILNRGKWELLEEEAYSRRERTYKKLVHLIERDRNTFDWTILAELDSERTAKCIYSDIYYMWEAVREVHDFYRDVYGTGPYADKSDE